MVFIRHLTIDEVLARQLARHEADVARHNASVIERLDLERVPLRRQALGEFPVYAQRLAR